MYLKQLLPGFLSLLVLVSCNGNSVDPVTSTDTIVPLPYFGQHEFDGADTMYHTIPSYSLLAHDSSAFTNDRVAEKIHVVNFFFTSCPSICPAMIGQMQRLQEMTSDIEEITFLS